MLFRQICGPITLWTTWTMKFWLLVPLVEYMRGTWDKEPPVGNKEHYVSTKPPDPCMCSTDVPRKGAVTVVVAHRVDWWRPLQWPSSNRADAHRFGTDSPPLTGKYGVYVSDIWRAYFSTHWTLRVQNTEWNVMSPMRNEPSKYGTTSDSHQIRSQNKIKSKLQMLKNCQKIQILKFCKNFIRDTTPSEVAW